MCPEHSENAALITKKLTQVLAIGEKQKLQFEKKKEKKSKAIAFEMLSLS